MTSPNPAQSAHAALTRGDPAALALFDQALRGDPGNAKLWLGKARALELTGDRKGARIVARQIADQAPGFLDAQAFLAQLRLSAGEADFTSHYTAAQAKHPRDPNIAAAHCETLAGLDHVAEAAEVAARARKQFPQEPQFMLFEAVHAGTAGDWNRADALYRKLDMRSPQRALHEARHRLRARDTEAAGELLGEALAANPWDIAAWALRGIVWRLAGDTRADWLHGQEGLIQMLPIEGEAGLLDEAAAELRLLHRNAAMPIGQSLRGGTQTRGNLFERRERVFADLQAVALAALETYRAGLPPADPTHPLLRHRGAGWGMAGSWSVRLTGGGDHHVPHIHPEGILSSALYLAVPDAAADDAARNGWLELGRPPRDLALDMPPVQSIQPRSGFIALFPSTMYHGTTAFGGPAATERMTAVFDVVPA